MLESIKERDERILDLVAKGHTKADIAEFTGLSESIVKRTMAKHKDRVAFLRKQIHDKKKISDEELGEKVRRLKMMGMTNAEAAKEVGKSPRWCEQFSIRVQEYQSGASEEEIRERYLAARRVSSKYSKEKTMKKYDGLSEEEREDIMKQHYHKTQKVSCDEKRKLIRQTNKLLGQDAKWKEIEKQTGRSRGFLYKLIKEEQERLKAKDKSTKAAKAGRAGAEARWSKGKTDEDRERRKIERRELRKKKPKEVEAIAVVEEERPKRVIGYARVSTQEQATGESIDTQEDSIPAYCKAKGWELVKIFKDPGSTGTNIRRPGLQGALRMIREDDIDVLVVFKVDRFARSSKDGLNLIFGPLKENRCDFAAIMEAFDTSTPAGEAMLGILLVFAQLESRTTGVRVSETKKFQKKRGEWIGRDVLGFKRIENRLVKVPEQQEKGPELFRLYKRGEAFRAIERITGVPRPTIKRIVRGFKSWKEYCEYYGQWAESCKRPILKEKK